MTEILQAPNEQLDANQSVESLAEAALRVSSGIAMLALQRTLDEGGTIEIPSLGIVIDNQGSGSVVELDQSDYSIE